MTKHTVVLSLLISALAAGAAHAGPGLGSFDSGFEPRVPVSSFARPASWFDASRLRFGTTVSVGSSFGGRTEALQVTSIGYQFGGPAWLNVSIGNSLGGSRARNSSAFFLEGLDFTFRPTSSMWFSVQYRDLRSPLQRQERPGYWAR